MNSLDRQCWICFTSASETPKNVRWVAPCKCSGDTQWVHEPCLLSWIIRKQSEAFHEGTDAPILIHEANNSISTSNAAILDYIEAGNETSSQEVANAIRQRMETRSRFMEMYQNYTSIVKCPQCHQIYEMQQEPRSLFTSLFMQTHSFVFGFSDYLVPLVCAGGVIFLFVSSSAAFGAGVIFIVCGANDPISRHLSLHQWNWREWLGVFSIPHYLVSLNVPVSQRTAGNFHSNCCWIDLMYSLERLTHALVCSNHYKCICS
jgi:hypothetical protein